MSEHTFPRYPREAMLYVIEGDRLRTPAGIVTNEFEITLTYDPDLTPDEIAILVSIVRYGRSETAISLDEWLAIEDDLTALRAFRQQTQAEFMALTATQRDRALFDAVNAQTNVLRALLRD